MNLWRDYDVTERLTAYVGGGIGGGGYQFSVNQEYPVQGVTVTGVSTVGGFAWQAGGGLAFAVTDRITLDLGYRFFELASGSVTAQVSQSGRHLLLSGIEAVHIAVSDRDFAASLRGPQRHCDRADDASLDCQFRNFCRAGFL